jgi:hypothetical protein
MYKTKSQKGGQIMNKLMSVDAVIDWHIEQAKECRQKEEKENRNFHLDIATTLIWQTKWENEDLRTAMCSEIISLKEAN